MEFFDVIDDHGNKTGAVVEREEAHKNGVRHRVIQVWVVNTDHEILIQKRSDIKDTYPGKWYVSLGGHIESGEDNVQAIRREFLEELGLDITPNIDDLKYLYAFDTLEYLNGGKYIDNELYDVYMLKMDVEIEALTLQEEEVSEVRFMPYEAFRTAVLENDKNFLIHEKGFRTLLDHLDVILGKD